MDTRETQYKEVISANLNNVLTSGYIPELASPSKHQVGKVRDIHRPDNYGDRLVMVASDRVSAFDEVLSRQIPFKGVVLNAFNKWAMEQTTDIARNALLDSPDPNVVVQRYVKNVGFEFIVRGHVWGSLAADYENGSRIKSIRVGD